MISLLYCGNEGVFDGVLTSLLSILKRSTPDTYKVYIFTMDLTRVKENYTPISDHLIEFLNKVMKSYNPENEVIKVDVTALYEEKLGHSPNEGTYVSPYGLIRCLVDCVEGIPDKILYLDIDIMFNRDIHLLWDYDLQGADFAAAPDHYGKFLIHPHYINSGVLLLDMKVCRETKLFEKAREMMNKKKLLFPDQTSIQRSARKKCILPQRFNDQKFLHESTVVRHFSKRLFYLPYPHTDNIKQYHIDKVHKVFKYHQFDDVYEEYLQLKKEYEEGKKQ